MTLPEYITSINKRYKLGNATEHTFRGDLQQLLESLVPGIAATNEPKRIKCGAPDYVITRQEIPIGFIEAKDIGADLESKAFKEQFDRYRASLNNLIFTDYLDFWLYRDGQFVTSVKIAEIHNGIIEPLSNHFPTFTHLIKDFCTHTGQTIKSSKRLAEMMAGKARMLSEVIGKALTSDERTQEDSTLKDQMNAFKHILIHDITPKEFADIYAQTVAYGMFAARLHDPTLPTFTRQEAAELIPKTNPFLRKLFGYIAGPDIDDRIKWIVDSLADIFRATDVAALLKNFGKATQMHDPIIHFYETFLAEYDPKLRKVRGVWYTPEPVVNFIVRAVDDILKTEFNLPQGLADISKTSVTVNTQIEDKRTSTGYKQIQEEVHRVQILDPATGTGTFLAEVVKLIHQKFEGQQGLWSNYVENHLIPRLNGFELLMASYAMAHLKMDMLLNATGYKPKKEQRFRIYLTNSLEESHPDTGTLFASWLSTEANEANHIKRDTPVMVIMGNPPYAVKSANKGEWIRNLLADYKKNLNERKINLDDDYIKFIRYGQYFIDKNGEGVLAYISNNSFTGGITHRQMRKHLLASFDKIYILDLHGNAKKKETCPDGSSDENVFDIMQGVSINILIKTGKKKKNELGEMYHSDIWGKRERKYEMLLNSSIKSLKWRKVEYKEPYYFFAQKDYQQLEHYSNWFSLADLFVDFNSGVKTDRDPLFIGFEYSDIDKRFRLLLGENYDSHFTKEYRVIDSGSYKITSKIREIQFENRFISEIQYRIFDWRFTYYDKRIVSRPAQKAMKHIYSKENVGLIFKRQANDESCGYTNFFLSKTLIIDGLFAIDPLGREVIAPLYLYPEISSQQSIEQIVERVPNLKQEIVKQISENLALTFTNEKITTEGTFAPIDILDYIYAVVHSPTYREKYKEFLKIDFPRIPYPKDKNTFWQLVQLGGKLRQLHLLESPIVNHYITSYPVDGDNVVSRSIVRKDWELYDEKKQLGRIWINDEQHFDKIPLTAWEFYIGGYQPAQKWLKDRKGRELSFEEILHYQKIIVALSETARLMKEIDKVNIE